MARRTDITRLVIKPYPRETAQASYLSLRRVLWKTCVYPPPFIGKTFCCCKSKPGCTACNNSWHLMIVFHSKTLFIWKPCHWIISAQSAYRHGLTLLGFRRYYRQLAALALGAELSSQRNAAQALVAVSRQHQ